MQEYRKRSLAVLNNVQEKNAPASVRVSGNLKTGSSINLSITETCNPTKECSKYCYGLRGPIGFSNSIAVQHSNTIRFNYLENASQEIVDTEVHAIAAQVQKLRQDWIRWNGVGDLIPGSVRIINRMAELYPNIIQWVVTRKVLQAKNLSDKKSIKILFSLDDSTPETIKNRAIELKKTFKKAKFRFAFTQRTAVKPPRIASIVFNEHIGRHKSDWKDSRVCEATVAGKNHEMACDSCRRCFA